MQSDGGFPRCRHGDGAKRFGCRARSEVPHLNLGSAICESWRSWLVDGM
jgi:hypothetical protein